MMILQQVDTLLYVGSSQSSWSCYFFPETSLECRQRAFELIKSEDAWNNGIVTTKENYTSKHIWAGPTPRYKPSHDCNILSDIYDISAAEKLCMILFFNA